MFIQVSLLRPQRGDNFLTYSVPEIFEETVSRGDIVEIPMRNERALGVVFSIFSEAPEFETKMMGRIVHHHFFSQSFLDFIQKISEYFFCSPSFFLAKSAPSPFFAHLPPPPQEKFYITKDIPEISEISSLVKGKKQQELCMYFLNAVETRCTVSLQETVPETELKQKFSSTIIKTALEKNYISEYFQEKYRENSRSPSGVEGLENNTKKNFYNLEPLNLHPQKNLILGSNHSAKNAVLAQWIAEKIGENKQVLFVFPDQMSLEQAYQKFQKIFPPEEIETYSSGMSTKKKEDLFFQLTSGYTKILLGTKNALFFSYKNLGGIIIHEYHNDLYITQSFPFTHAKDIAKIRAESENIPLIFEASGGDIDETFFFSQSPENGKISEFSPPLTTSPPQIIDMNLEKMNKNTSPLSYSLEVALEKNIQKKEQSLLFLNRKGMFTSLFCSECKWTPTSPLSGNKLGVFKDRSGKKVLRCSQSKYHEKFPDVCPQCHKNTLIEIGKGTQEIEQVLQQKFPNARIFRADKDSLSSPVKTKNFLDDINAGELDIVVGTQLIVQAFPFEKVSLVANIMTENDILFPSYKSEEKGLLKNQKFLDVVGKMPETKKILQTFCPQHRFIQTLAHSTFQEWYSSEISARKALGYPPFSESIQIIKNAKTEKSLEKLFQEIQKVILPQCEKLFPIHISYHPQRNLFTAKLLCFTQNSSQLWQLLSSKGVTFHRYAE